MKKIWNSLIGMMLGMVLMLGMPVLDAQAAEYTVTATEAVLYTNENTVILSDADDSAVVISGVAADLPIQVTGITSNGYFQINLDGQTFYIHGIGLSAANTTNQIYETIIAQKAVFPEGMHWTNDNYYGWKGGTYTGGFGCAGFAFAVSDAAFGNTRAQIHKDYTNIRVGDILRVDNDTHSVIVLEVKENSVIVAEGNYNAAIHWGREIPISQLIDPHSYIMTRY
ncbi:MAG: LPS export ABC transporter periplasmic protein LptC [Lachnospiraceae bacterium]|nr:LPS export ABC transporter periplasmic protein LptC [Lachnospiraceae bacterium]